MVIGTTSASDVLVSTEWIVQHARDANLRIVEVDVDTTAYGQGHVPGAIGWNVPPMFLWSVPAPVGSV